MPLLDTPIDQQALQGLCQRHRVARLELFGSRARSRAHADSDIDLLVTFTDGDMPGLEFIALAGELKQLFSQPVALLTRHAVEGSANPIRRRSIPETLYAA